MKVTMDQVVAIDYILTVDGQIIDQSEPGEPLHYLHGAQNIIPGLEKALANKVVGDSFFVSVPPEEGYGIYDPENVQKVSQSDFDDDIEIGETYFAENEDGSIYPFRILKVEGDDVWVDFNPELAGKTLNFEVTVCAIREATEDEMIHGHPHVSDEHSDH
ncbi:MAG: peptidylprolyl isomerase [Deinococcaceae bacterium]